LDALQRTQVHVNAQVTGLRGSRSESAAKVPEEVMQYAARIGRRRRTGIHAAARLTGRDQKQCHERGTMTAHPNLGPRGPQSEDCGTLFTSDGFLCRAA